jgi:hypothetical protein
MRNDRYLLVLLLLLSPFLPAAAQEGPQIQPEKHQNLRESPEARFSRADSLRGAPTPLRISYNVGFYDLRVRGCRPAH